MILLRKSVYCMLFSLFLHGCMGMRYTAKVDPPLLKQQPFATALTASYQFTGDFGFWNADAPYNYNGYCNSIWWTSINIPLDEAFKNATKRLLANYYKYLEQIDSDETSPEDHYFVFHVTNYWDRGRMANPASPLKDRQPGVARFELDLQVVLTDRTGKGPGFAKEYHLQAEAPVSDMSTCEKYDKQGELSSQLMTEFFAQFQTDLVTYLKQTESKG